MLAGMYRDCGSESAFRKRTIDPALEYDKDSLVERFRALRIPDETGLRYVSIAQVTSNLNGGEA